MRRAAIPNRACMVALLAATLCATVGRPASAQVARADSAAVLLGAAADLDRRGEGEVAEALYRHIVDLFAGTPAAETARAMLEAAVAGRSQAGGETELKVWSTTYGIWLGIAVPAALGADTPEPYGVGLLLGAPGGFFTGRAFVRSRPLSLGQARAITWGGTWGAFQGLALANALDIGGQSGADRPSDEAIFASMIAGGAVGIAGGAVAARREITPGTATSATAGSLWGTWFGVASSVLLDLDEDPTLATMMIAGNAGLAAGALAGSRWPLSRSRARLISVGGLIGGVAGLGVLMIADAEIEDRAIAIPLAGSVVGLVLGAVLTEGHDAEEDMSGNVEAAGAHAATGALFNRSRGYWSLSVPLPSPVLDASGRAGPNADGATTGRPGLVWRIPLLNVRF